MTWVMLEWTADAIERLAAEYCDSRRLFARLWADIEILAARVVAVAPAGGPEATVAWHHFMLAVGNFSGHAPVHPGSLPNLASPRHPAGTPDVLAVPDIFGTLRRDGAGTWAELTLIDGVEVHTATAVLAALWPDDHFIFDEWVMHVAGAMRAAQDERYLDSTDPPYAAPTLLVYSEVRPWFLGVASEHGVPLQHVQRAALLLSQRLKNDPARPWRRYIEELNARLART